MMSAKVSPDAPCLSPCYEYCISNSTFNGYDDTKKDLPNVSDNDDFHTIQLLQSKIDVLNATITHQKFKFAQEYNEIKNHHQIRIDMLKKSAKKAEQAKPLVQPSRELLKMEEENRQLSSTISDLHQLLADQMARSSSENEQLCSTIADLQHKLHNQLLNPDDKDNVKERLKRDQMDEAEAARTKDLEMDCRRLKSLVSQVQMKLAEEQERQKVSVENSSHLKVQLAACRSDNEDMKLTFKASSEQASDTIFNLRQQLSQTTKEQAKQVAKMRQELELIYEEKLRTAEKEKVNTEKEVKDCKKRIEALVKKSAACRSDKEEMILSYKASSKQASDTIFNLKQQLSQNIKEQTERVAKMRQELEEVYQDKLRAAEKEKADTEKKVVKLAVTNNKIKQSFVNQPVLTSQNLNPKYFTMCRQSLENMVDSYQQRLIYIEQEYQSLKLDDAIKQKEINVLKSRLAIVVEQQLRERRAFEAEIDAVQVAAKMMVEKNYANTVSSNKKSGTYAQSSRKRKSFSPLPSKRTRWQKV